MLVHVTAQRDNERGPEFIRQCFEQLHADMTNQRLREPFCVRFSNAYQQVGLFLQGPRSLVKGFEAGLLSRYEGCQAEELDEADSRPPVDYHITEQFVRLRPDCFPLRADRWFDDERNRTFADPIAGILDRLNHDEAFLQLDCCVQPAKLSRIRRARRLFDLLECPVAPRLERWRDFLARWATNGRLHSLLARCLLSTCFGSCQSHDGGEDKVRGHNLFSATIRLTVGLPPASKVDPQTLHRSLLGSLAPLAAPPRPGWELCPRPVPFLLTARELCFLWHPTTATVATRAVARAESRQMEPPTRLPSPLLEPDDVAPLGKTWFHGRSDLFGIRTNDRLRHFYIVGKTGQGKSTLLLNMLAADLKAGRGVLLLDPHGELYDDALAIVPNARRDQLIAIDPSEPEQRWGINLLDGVTEQNRSRVISSVLGTFFRLFDIDQASAPRLTRILQVCVATLLDTPGTSLINIEELLISRPYRQRLIRNIKDTPDRQSVLAFWDEYGRWNERYRTEAIAAVLNKIELFTSDAQLRRILDANQKQLSLRRAMAHQQIVLVNLSKGKMGEFASSLLGSFLVTALEMAALSRADLPKGERTAFFSYVDEFQSYTSDSFATILSEARKYGLALTLSHQFTKQLDEQTLHAVLGNVGSLLTFQVGSHDARIFADEFGEGLLPRDFMRLPKFTAYLRLMTNGTMSPPFSMKTLPATQPAITI